MTDKQLERGKHKGKPLFYTEPLETLPFLKKELERNPNDVKLKQLISELENKQK